MNRLIITILSLSVIALTHVEGHGYLAHPAARGSAWREGFHTPKNFDDMGLFCGGKNVQHQQNGGRCGVCGDNYSANLKPNEPGRGNIYATGTIVAKYNKGQTVEVTVETTAYHKGYYEFRLCENNVPQKGKDPRIAVQQSCFNKNLLSSPSGNTKFSASKGTSKHLIKLPDHVTCSACVLQWRYRAGNTWGCENDKCGLGLGPQEEFWGCSDISISGNGETQSNTRKPDTPKNTTPRPVFTKPSHTGKTCFSVPPYKNEAMDSYCKKNCLAARPYCPKTHCKCV